MNKTNTTNAPSIQPHLSSRVARLRTNKKVKANLGRFGSHGFGDATWSTRSDESIGSFCTYSRESQKTENQNCRLWNAATRLILSVYIYISASFSKNRIGFGSCKSARFQHWWSFKPQKTAVSTSMKRIEARELRFPKEVFGWLAIGLQHGCLYYVIYLM